MTDVRWAPIIRAIRSCVSSAVQPDALAAYLSPSVGEVPQQKQDAQVHVPELLDCQPEAEQAGSTRSPGHQDRRDFGPGPDARSEIPVEPRQAGWLARGPGDPGVHGADFPTRRPMAAGDPPHPGARRTSVPPPLSREGSWSAAARPASLSATSWPDRGAISRSWRPPKSPRRRGASAGTRSSCSPRPAMTPCRACRFRATRTAIRPATRSRTYLTDYARRFDLPVELNSRVNAIRSADTVPGRARRPHIQADQVVVATGAVPDCPSCRRSPTS